MVFIQESAKRSSCFRDQSLQPLGYISKGYLKQYSRRRKKMQRLYTEKCSLIEKARRAWYHLKNERRRKRMESIGLYIHIPFCRQKCLYCDFPSWHSWCRRLGKAFGLRQMQSWRQRRTRERWAMKWRRRWRKWALTAWAWACRHGKIPFCTGWAESTR